MAGKATLKITVDSNNVQISNYGTSSFQFTNTGDKNIAKLVIDVSNALYPDSIFDPFGPAGDSVFKPLSIDTNGNTGVVATSAASYIGTGGRSGYKGLQMNFASNVNGGFNPGETVSFSIDMDPNSVAGTNKSQLDGGTSPAWDVGGVSGAELIGSTFAVTFTDGTTATGQLQGVGNQGGAQGLAAQDSPNLPVSLTVNGLGVGGVGTYDPSGVSVIVSGPAGQTARVVLTKGFIQPVTSYAQFLADQLATLATTGFPANNAVEFQTVDILLTGGNQDISNRFNLSGVPIYNFAGEDKLPLGFVASVIDPTNSNLPIGPVTQPIYLKFVEGKVVKIAATTQASEPSSKGLFTVSLAQVATIDTVVTYSVAGNAIAGTDYTALSGTVTILSGQQSATIDVPVLDDKLIEDPETVIVTLTGVTGDAGLVLGTAKTATVNITDDEVPLTGLTIQAESITNVSGYRLESNGVASGGSMLSLAGGASNETGTATFTFTKATGNYNIILGTFDENDGAATLQVAKNGTSIGSVLLNQNLGSASAVAATKVEKSVATGMSVNNGDSFTVTGIENASEHARFDFIRFEPVNSAIKQVSIATITQAKEPSSKGVFTFSLSQAATTDTVVAYSVTGNATAGSDYTALSGTVTIPVNQQSATIDVSVLDDKIVENAESVIVSLTGATGDADLVLGANKTATVTIADDDSPIRLEAEAASPLVNYRQEAIGVASGGQVLSFAGGNSGESGSVNFGFNGTAGAYDVLLGTFDENDGAASFTVQLKDVETNTTTQIASLTLNTNLGSNVANAQTFISPKVALGVNLTPGDSLIVNGLENGSEHARLDFLQLNPVLI
jgi:hypothetical protein